MSDENHLLEKQDTLLKLHQFGKARFRLVPGTCHLLYWPSVNWSVPRSTGRDWSSWSAVATSCCRSVTVSLVADISPSSTGEIGIFSLSTLLDPIVEMSSAVPLVSEPSLSKFTTYLATVLLDLQGGKVRMPRAEKSVTGWEIIFHTNKSAAITYSVRVMQIYFFLMRLSPSNYFFFTWLLFFPCITFNKNSHIEDNCKNLLT